MATLEILPSTTLINELSTDGTVSLPGIAFASDTDSGIYRIGTNNIGVAVNATKILDIATTGLSVVGTITGTSIYGSATATAATSGTNVDSCSATVCNWIRIGNRVSVSGECTINLTTTLLASDIQLALPVASTLAQTYQLSGTCVGIDTNAAACGRILADTSNHTAKVSLKGVVGTGDIVYSYHYSYIVI